MAISFVDSASNRAINGADVTLTLSDITGLQTNDLMIAAYTIGDDDSVDQTMAIVSPTGWTGVADIFATSAGTDKDTNFGVFYKFHNGTDTNVVVDGLGGTDAAVAACVMAFRGVNTGTPFDVTSTTATGQDTFHPNPPSIDWTTAGTWTVIAAGSAHAVANTNNYTTWPTGYTTNPVTIADLDTTGATVGLGYRTNPADPEDPGTITHSGTDSAAYSWCAVTMALREAVPVTNPISVVMAPIRR